MDELYLLPDLIDAQCKEVSEDICTNYYPDDVNYISDSTESCNEFLRELIKTQCHDYCAEAYPDNDFENRDACVVECQTILS